MEPAMKAHLDRHIDDNAKLKVVYQAHQSYGKKIAKMEKKKILNAEDTIEMTRLKKLKLQQKDELEKILREEHDYS